MLGPHDRRAAERSHLTRFLASLAEPPVGNRIFRDRPDLVIETATGRLGIEHTQLVQSRDSLARSNAMRSESLESRVVERAQGEFEAAGGPLLDIHFHFSQRPMRKSDVNGIARALVAAVNEIIESNPSPDDPVEAWRYNRGALNPLPAQIEYLWIDHGKGESLWGVTRSGGILVMDQDRIQAEIDVKDAKVAEYRSECDELWLLLVSDGFSPSTALKLPEEVGELQFTTGFDRVFYFNNFENTSTELAMTAKTAG